MNEPVRTQDASVNLPDRRLRDFSRFSITSVRSPVSIALELATALRMLARETDTLSESFLRTMERLQGKITPAIITSEGFCALQIVPWGSGVSHTSERCQQADKLGINTSAVQKHNEKLKEAGAIDWIGGTRGY